MYKTIRISKRSKKILIGITLLSFFLLTLFHKSFLLFIGDLLVIEDDLHPADVIHVIAGEEFRLNYAIQLYQQGYGEMIFLTGGGWCPQHQIIHEGGWRAKAIEQGVSTENVVINDNKITSTYSEAERLKAWIENNLTPVRSIIVVSDPFHMRRARWTYKRVLGKNFEVQMAPVPFELTPFNRIWWKDWESRKNVREEYEKYIYYILRYKISWGKFQEWLVSLDRE